MIYIIGCGGVGSWLLPKLVKLIAAKSSPSGITLIDGDTLERKNLDRQLFDERDIGRNKAEALADKYGCKSIPEYFAFGDIPFGYGDVIFVAADNHAARRAALISSDNSDGAAVIIGANEYTDAEAYIYFPDWKDTVHDPRVFYPSINTDTSGDPMRPAGCTGEAALVNPQLGLANDSASGFMLHLYYFWSIQKTKYPEQYRPVHHKVSMMNYTTIKFGEK